MTEHFDPETVDLAKLAQQLVATCGARVAGEVMGRTRIRDEVASQLRCSALEAEQLVDTMVARGFLVRHEEPGRLIEWLIETTP